MVWLAPVPRSRGGRSAVSTTSGTRACEASTTAGQNSAAAVPLVQAIATGGTHGLGDPQRGERARTFVEMHVHLDPVVPSERKRDRRGARPGRDACVPDPAQDELIDQERGARQGQVAQAHSAREEHEAERGQQTARGMGGRRAGEHGDQVASGGRADDLHGSDRKGPGDQPEQRPLRDPDGFVRDVGQDADRQGGERRHDARSVERHGCAGHPGGPPGFVCRSPCRSGCPAGCWPPGSPPRAGP